MSVESVMPSNHLILCCPLLLGRCKLIISLKSVSPPQSPSDNRHTQSPQSVYIRISGGFRERNWKEVGQVVTGEEKQKKRIVPSFRSAGLAFGRESAERSGSPLIPRKHSPLPITGCSAGSCSEHLIATQLLPKWDCSPTSWHAHFPPVFVVV